MFLLFTDYGNEGPYIGQVETVLHGLVPEAPVINLMADAPVNNPKASAYLLAALIDQAPGFSILCCVVDPGVGTDLHTPIALNIDHRWLVGPDNGLFDIVCRQAFDIEAIEINWRPEQLSNSFHGRDLYAPVCAKIARNKTDFGKPFKWQDKHNWPDDLNEIIYIDHFGNCMTGVRAVTLEKNMTIEFNGERINYAETFGKVKPGQAFWYKNSNGLVEIAVNQGSAARKTGLKIGDVVTADLID